MFRCLLPLSLSLALLGSAIAQDKVIAFHEGDSARVTAPAPNPDGTPTFCFIYPTLQAARETLALYTEATRTGKTLSAEGLVAIGHNTRATVRAVESIEVDGKPDQVARVRLESSPLEGGTYWIFTRRLRPADAPDPLAAPPTPRSLRDLFWDPEYKPRDGDSVILASKDSKTRGPAAVTLFPEGGGAAGGRAFGDWNCFAVASATTAVVVKARSPLAGPTGGAIGSLVLVKITSGPFVDQTGSTLDKNLCRPEVFQRAIGPKEIAPVADADPPRAPVKRQSRRRQGSAPPAPTGDLLLTDVAANPSSTGNYMIVTGRFRNASDNPLRSIRVTVSFEDRSGKLVRSAWSFCAPRTIEAGGIGSFEVSAENDERYAGFKLSFRDQEAAISWVDQSGKNVHD